MPLNNNCVHPFSIDINGSIDNIETSCTNNKLEIPKTTQETKKKGVEERRYDIQGLRTLAITAVLLFHIWPEIFHNGYLGVDMFFVLSGYLMAQILTRRAVSFTSISHFYSRRIHRIVPTYMVVIFATFAACSVLVMDIDFVEVPTDCLWSLTFTSNLEDIYKERSYFDEVHSSFRFLLHSWSLGVEMQFYLLIPVFIWLFAKTQHVQHNIICRVHLVLLIAIITLSRAYQWYAADEMGFGMVFARFWEFFMGISAHYFGEFIKVDSAIEESECDSKKSSDKPFVLYHYKDVIQSYSTVSILIVVLFIPSKPANTPDGLSNDKTRSGWPDIFQVIVILCAATLLNCQHHTSHLLTNRLSVELGDLSYVWYLVHWPLIQLVKYRYTIIRFSFISGIIMLLATFTLAIAINVLVDRNFRKIREFRTVLFATGLLYACTLAVVYPQYLDIKAKKDVGSWDVSQRIFKGEFYNISEYGYRFVEALDGQEFDPGNLSMEEVLLINKKMSYATGEYWGYYGPRPMSVNYSESVEHNEWEFHATFNGSGELTMLLVGNSHADHITPQLATAFAEVYKVLYVYTAQGCIPFNISYDGPDRILWNADGCVTYPSAVKKLVSELKPDVLFINFFWQWIGRPPLESPIEQDSVLRDIQKGLDGISSSAKIVYFGAPGMYFDYWMSHEIAKKLWMNTSLSDLNIKHSEYLEKEQAHLVRMKHLKCPKCIYVDWSEVFCAKEGSQSERICQSYDPISKLAIFSDGHHYSFYGSTKVLPFLKEKAANFDEDMTRIESGARQHPVFRGE